MTNYILKILELIGIENRDDKCYLKVIFTFEETIEILLEVDSETAGNLKRIVEFDGKSKYRLSFKSFYDNSANKYLGVIIKSFKDNSEIFYFQCSEEYISKLNVIKDMKTIDDLDKLFYISKESTLLNDEIKDNNPIIAKNKNLKLSHVLTAITGFLLILVLSYFSQFHLNKAYFNEEVLAESINTSTIENQEWQYEPINYYNSTFNYIEKNIFKIQELEEEAPTEYSSDINDDLGFIELEDYLVYNLPEGKVALTFDDGPSQYTKEIIDILKEYKVGATFFLVGYNVRKYPDYAKYIHSNGYSIGSHSMSHLDMSKLSYEKQKNELISSINILKETIDEDISLFRPPYGSFNKQLENLVISQECKIVLWNNDPEDWKTRDADKIFESIKNSNTSGAIILLHESQAVIDSLPRIIEYLQGQNLEIVNLK